MTSAEEPLMPILSRAEIMAWRKEERQRQIAARLAISAGVRATHAEKIIAHLRDLIRPLAGRSVSAYWPFKGEPDLRDWLQSLEAEGGRCALPVVVEKNAPLVFRVWQKGGRLVPGVWNIPVPADGTEIVPDIVIAPLVGYEAGLYRLGYGGGFFDRTLASLSPRPMVIGVGYAQAELPSIHPLPHDIPMNAIVTERGILKA